MLDSQATPIVISPKETNNKTDCKTDAFQSFILFKVVGASAVEIISVGAFISSKSCLHEAQFSICSLTIFSLSSLQHPSIYNGIKSFITSQFILLPHTF